MKEHTVKPVLSGQSKRRPKVVFKTDYCLMQVKSIAECSKGSILQYFRPSLSYSLLFRSLLCSVVPRSRFLGDTSVPLPEFLRDICKFWGTHQFHLIFACKIENSFPEISVRFYLHLSSMTIVLAQEGVQITVK